MRANALAAAAAAVAMATGVSATAVTDSGVVPVEVPTTVQQVSFDGRMVCAVTAMQGVICGLVGLTGTVSSWMTRFRSNATWVAVAKEDMWLLDASHQLQYSPTSTNGTWKPNKNAAFGGVVASDGACTCNMYLNGKPICAAASGRADLQWFTNGIERESLAIDVGQRLVVGINYDGSTYAYKCGEYLEEQQWLPVSPGPYRSIATDGEFTCATKDTTETVFCYHNTTGDWQPIAATFTQIALRDARLYGVSSNGTLWTTTLKMESDERANLAALKMAERDAEVALSNKTIPDPDVSFGEMQQVETPAAVTRVSYDGSRVCVAMEAQDASCAEFESNEQLYWNSLGRKLKSIVVAGDKVWGLPYSALDWSYVASDSSEWKSVDGTLWTKLASDGSLVCGIRETNTNGRDSATFCLGGESGKLNRFPGLDKLADIGIAANGTIYGVRLNDSVFSFRASLFPSLNGSVRAIASDGNILCATEQATGGLTCTSRKSRRWVNTDAVFIDLSLYGGRLFAVDSSGKLWTMRVALKGESLVDPHKKSKGNHDRTHPSAKKAASGGKSGSGTLVAVIITGIVVSLAAALFIYRSVRRAKHSSKTELLLEPETRESDVVSPTDGSSAKDSQHDDEDADANTQTVVGRVTVPQARYSNLGDWMNDPALLYRRIPRRRVVFGEILSRGAFGEVYRGRYDDTDVAIKVLAPDRRRLMHEIEDFAKEALFLTALEHDRIVRLIGVAWTAPSDLCIVSELMNGGDVLDLLRQYQREGHPQGFTKFKATIALHVAEALVYLHSQSPKLLHRDLKSKNIMLTETGDAKLTDFGVARTWEDLTLTAGVGSLLWMAPEVVFGDRYDEKADIYSFGVVLSELDTHELPYSHASVESTASSGERLPELAICQLVAAGELSIDFSDRCLPELRALGLSCVAVEPKMRPSASRVLRRLKEVVGQLLAESEVESSKDGSSAKDSQHDDEDADANTQTVVGRVTVPQARYSNLGDWMNDPALLYRRIPRRRVVFGEILSRGAFGEVYRGRYDDTDVAIKVLAPDRRRLMHEIEDFAKEALFLTALEHDRIVRLIGVAWTAPSDLCIVSELMNGGDVLDLLRQYQREGHPQGFTKFKATIALHVAEALVYLHSQSPKLLHRDLKSKNIMLTETGDAKLTDFGVARTWEDLTLTAGVGSLLWMAPEVVFGDRYDEKADIYSFGVVLSELDTHELPYSHASVESTASSGERLPELAICQLVAAGELSIDFSDRCLPELRALGLSCVAVEPKMRPSASRVLRRLKEVVGQLLAESEVESSKDGSSAKDSQHDDEDADANTQTVVGRVTVPQARYSNLGDWMNDPALLYRRIPRRRVVFGEILSRGAFGEVYRGRYDDTDVAIKVLAPDRRRLMHEIEDFAKEALFLTALEHDRIVRLIGVAWTAPSDLCIVSELMNGGDVLDLLRQYQREGHPQGFTKFKATIALHVAEALVYLHSQSPKLLHRDLKSKNIMLTETGDAKLTDFGVARTWEDLTLTAGVGSLLWMAPEVVFGDRYDEKADIYSFGVVLSELDTHELPYSHASVESTASSGERLPELAICQLVAAGELSIDFSDRCLPELRALGLSCVAVEPKMRPSASRVLRRLKEVVGQLLAESEVESSKDGSSAKDSQHDDEDADANTQTVVGRVTVPQARYSNLGDWMNDPALLYRRIPRRRVVFGEILSRGAFGEVYRGRYDDTDVAIKVLAPDRRRLMHEIEDFAKEALFLTALEHDRIVRLIGVAWTAPSDLCIVSELMNGGDVLDLLRQYQREGHPQGFTKFKATIALHVAEALVYLHSQSPKLLHRDLKSKNIMLTETGDAKLTDFGVARTWEDLTLTAGVGSLLWMAPEVVFGDRYDEKADIYSFGVVLSELDTHELPYSHASVESTASSGERLPELAICQLVAAGELSIDFSDRCLPELRALGLSCVAVEPKMRPSASRVLRRLKEVLALLQV